MDLPFEAKSGRTYLVYYDVFPPYVNRMEQPGFMDGTTGQLIEAAAQMDVAAVLMFYPIVAAGTGAMVMRVGNTIAEDSKPAKHVDVMVVAQHCSQGVACTRRVHADGRIENR